MTQIRPDPSTIETISIKPAPMSMDRAIAFYEALNDVGKAGFILTLQEQDRQPFLEAYQAHYYKNEAIPYKTDQ